MAKGSYGSFGYSINYTIFVKRKKLSIHNRAVTMSKNKLSEQKINRLSMLTEEEMRQECSSWSPMQWAMYMTKGQMVDDDELDRFIEEEIIEH